MKHAEFGGKKFINLCPHDVTIVLLDGSEFVVPQSGEELRCKEEKVCVDSIGDNLPLYLTRYSELQFKSDQYKSVWDGPTGIRIVSSITMQEIKNKYNRVSKNGITYTSPADLIRDELGNVVSCRGIYYI